MSVTTQFRDVDDRIFMRHGMCLNCLLLPSVARITMKISIVTICRNNSRGLAKTLESVRSQHFGDIEHIIVDGESTDDTTKILQASDAKALTTSPKGVYNAINVGISATSGDIIGLLHAGDVFADSKVLDDIAHTFDNQRCDYLYGNIFYVNGRGKVTRRYRGASSSLSQLLHGNMPPHPSLYMTRDCLSRIGQYVENYKICGDFDMFIRLFSDADLKGFYFDRDVVAMATGGMSTTIYNRLFTNPRERLSALRAHGLPANPLRMLSHYINIIFNRL